MASIKFFTLLAMCLVFSFNVSAQNGEPKKSDKYFGEKIKTKKAISYEDLILQMEKQDTVEALVEGNVEAVCQAKGCWMEVGSKTNPDAAKIFVKFKDYAFFMPKDLAGSTVVFRGKAYKEIIPVDDLKHYAEDAGKSQAEIDAIVKPEVRLRFMADGVAIK
jgi:hypothetical protein